MDNPLGVIVGGLFLGILEALTSLYIGSTFADVASFGVLVLVLIVRPNGLLGKAAWNTTRITRRSATFGGRTVVRFGRARRSWRMQSPLCSAIRLAQG